MAGKLEFAQAFLKFSLVFRTALAPVAVAASMLGAAEFVDQNLRHYRGDKQPALLTAHRLDVIAPS